MTIWESIKTAWQSIFANKLRSSLTMLGLMIGVAAVVLLVSLGQGYQASVTSTFNSLGATAFYVTASRDKTIPTVRPLTTEDVAALQDPVLAPSVGIVSPTLGASVTVSYGNSNDNVPATGVLPVITKIRSYPIDQGRFINDQDETDRAAVVVLGWQTNQDLFGGQNAIGQFVRVSGQRFEVIGTCQKLGGFSGDGYLLMPLTTMQSDLVGGTDVSQIAIQAVNPNQVDNAISEVTAILAVRHYIMPGQPYDFTVTDNRQTLQSLEGTLAAFSLFLGSVGAISLIVGGIGIMNIMLVSVTERTREIGIRKAIGARRSDILVQFLIEAALLSVTGGLVGMVVAMIGSVMIGHVQLGNMTVTPVISPSIIMIALGVSIGTGLLSGTYPAFRAAQLDPIESLRHE